MSQEDFPPTFEQPGAQYNLSHTYVAGDTVEGDKTVYGEAYGLHAAAGEDSVAGNEYHLDLRDQGGTPITIVGGGEPLAPDAYQPPITDTLPKQYDGSMVHAEAGVPTREIGGGHGGTARQLGLVSLRRGVAQSNETGIRAFTEERRRLGRY